MTDSDKLADPAEFLPKLPFVCELDIRLISSEPGAVTVEMPFAERFSTPPRSFPASMVGILGDVAAVSACLSKLPGDWAVATLDYTVKMTGQARGDALIAKGRVLQAGKTTSVGISDVFCVSGGQEAHCGVVLATSRNFPLK